jgi:LysM repeat protein
MLRRSLRTLIVSTVILGMALSSVPILAQETIHIVQYGENLYRIALHYGVSMDALAQANGITNQARIFAGQKLIIPDFDASAPVVENPTLAGTPIYHTVAPGETLESIARKYGMTIQQLVEINQIANPNRINRGQQLTVWATTPTESDPGGDDSAQIAISEALSVEPSTENTYQVQNGDHLALIARRFGITWTELAQANNLSNPDQIYTGQTLIIPTASTVTDLGIIDAPPAPQFIPALPTVLVGRQVVVDLSDQMTYAYQDGVLTRSVRVSTGLPGTPTVQGDFTVYRKWVAQTMSGPGYFLPDVPYVMYFYRGYALHGTYWHNNFGNPMSHGCVNMPTPEAEWFFNNFVDVGTLVHVQA